MRVPAVLAFALAAAPLAALAQASPAPDAATVVPPGATSEDPAITKTATALVSQAQSGKIDRTLFDPQMSAELTDDYVAKAKAQMGPLGVPKTITYTGQAMAGVSHIYRYRIEFADGTVVDELLAFDPDGKIGGWRFRQTAAPTPDPEQPGNASGRPAPHRPGAG